VLKKLYPASERKKEILTTMKKIPSLSLPYHHQIFWENANKKRLEDVFMEISSRKIDDFEALLGVKGVGIKTVRTLALLSEIICDNEISFRGSVRYSFAHSSKDGHHYPIDRKT